MAIEVGDYVRIKKGSGWAHPMDCYIGKIVKITEKMGDGYRFDGSDSWLFLEDSFEKLSKDFKVGDWVKLHKTYYWNSTGHMDHFEGRVVQLTRVEGNNGWFDNMEGWSFDLDSFEKIEEPIAKPKEKQFDIVVGDWIEITKGKACWNEQMDKFIGKKVQVTRVDSSSQIIHFKDDEDWSWHYLLDHFKKCDSPEDKKDKDSNFKPGDWITILKSDNNWGGEGMDAFVGKTVQITRMHPTDTEASFKGGEGWHWCFRNKHFRMATLDEITKASKEEGKSELKDGFIFTFLDKSGKFQENSGKWFWNSADYAFPFKVLGINAQKYSYQQKVLGYTSNDGCFPWCKTIEDLYKLCKALETDIKLSKETKVISGKSEYFEGATFFFLYEEGTFKRSTSGWYWGGKEVENCYAFNKLGIDKGVYQEKILGYNNCSSSFPWCKSLEDLVKLCKSLEKDLKEKEKERKEGESFFDKLTLFEAKSPLKSIYTSDTGRIKPVIIKVPKI